MKTFSRFCTLIAVLAAIAFPLHTAATELDKIPPPPIEWGTISKADLEMKTYPADTNASAVILCDYGETKTDDDFNLVYTRHLRVKILNQKGFRWGTHSISTYNDREHGETLDKIEGMTYVLDSNGNIVEHELKERDIFEEEASDDFNRHKFTLPSLQSGCVIEIKYTIIAHSLVRVRDWVFQDDEPVLWSEYRLIYPSSIAYAVVRHGYEQFRINEQSDPKLYFSGHVAAEHGGNIVTCRFWRWAMKDLPALRQEPYITTLNDYYSSISLQFSGYSFRGTGVQNVLNTWEELVKQLKENKYIGDRITTSGDVKDLAQKLTANLTSPLEKMKAIYAWVSRSIVWDGERSIFSDQTMDHVLESKKGNSADINYLLVSLLNAAGVQADQIILSTRSHGLLQMLYPMTRQFNHGMARVMIDSTQFFLDATEPARPYTIVPSQTLGVRALVLRDDENVEWITVTSKVKSVSTIAATITLDETGAVKGAIDGIFKDYANINVRNDLRTMKPVDVVKEYFSLGGSGITIDSAEVINKDSVDKPIILKSLISSDSYGQVGGGLLYVNPHIISRWKDNPFKSAERKFPVDYNYPREYTSYVNLTIPDSFEIQDVFPNKSVNLDGQVKYTRELVIDDNRFQLKTKFEILSKEIAPRNYKRLKDFYSTMIQTESEQLVLKKKHPAPPPVTAAPAPAMPAIKTKQASARKK